MCPIHFCVCLFVLYGCGVLGPDFFLFLYDFLSYMLCATYLYMCIFVCIQYLHIYIGKPVDMQSTLFCGNSLHHCYSLLQITPNSVYSLMGMVAAMYSSLHHLWKY